MKCSRCGRAESHGAVFVEIGDAEEAVTICGACLVERHQARDPITVAPTTYETKTRPSLRERTRAKGKTI